MIFRRRTRSSLPISAVALVLLVLSAFAAEVPDPLPDRDGNPADMSKALKVCILGGQSNMERHVRVETFDCIGDQPLKEMIDSIGSQGGLCVHVGVRDGSFAMQLSQGGKYLVHGLSSSAEKVQAARKSIAAARLSGVVSVEQGIGKKLPYADNIVNLLVADDLAGLSKEGMEIEEVVRVLAPGGVAWLGQASDAGKPSLTADALTGILAEAGVKDFEILARPGTWAKITKPRPQSMDEWTHTKHDASNNPVSTDKEMAVPNGIRWVAGPTWPTGYRKGAISTRVVSKKHLISIFHDEIQTADGPQEQWSLIVRDAYNGLLLWKKQVWQYTHLVSVGDRIYLVEGGQLVALDADTGRLLQTYKNAKAQSGFLYIDDKLITSSKREGVGCLDPISGEVLWSQPNNAGDTILGFNAGNGKIFLNLVSPGQDGQTAYVFQSLDLATGKQLWKKNAAPWCKGRVQLVFNQYDVLVVAGEDATHGVSAEDGTHLWTYKYPLIGHGGSYGKVLAIGGLIWVHNAKSTGDRHGWEGLDPQTGKVVKRVVEESGFPLGHRCTYDTATPGFIICGSFDFADLQTGKYKKFYAVKNGCNAAGVVPANGIAYTFPHGCRCRNWVRGFLACAATTVPDADAALSEPGRLQKGPAFGAATGTPKPSTEEWPTYRNDAGRTAATATAGPQRLDKLWETQVTSPALASQVEWDARDGGRLTAPVVAQGLVFVAATDQHGLMAFDAETGAPRWNFIAGGRIDCPPTVYAGLCLFGSRDGWVYCLTAKDGRLVWRYRAAPQESKIVAYGQMESVWPVVGGVLVYDGLAYFAAGRHSDIDGGIVVAAVEPETGTLVWTQSQAQRGTPDIWRSTPDVLIGCDGNIEMGAQSLSAKDGSVTNAREDRFRAGRLGLLNDAWYTRALALRDGLQSWHGQGLSGQLIAFNDSAVSWFEAGKPKGQAGAMTGTAALSAMAKDGRKWGITMPYMARLKAMALTPDRVYVAGLLYDSEKDDSPANAIRIYSLADGRVLGEYAVKDQFIHDCLAVSGSRLYATTQSGKIICLDANN